MYRVKNVMIFDNGMVVVFDYSGNQIPALQGRWDLKFREVFNACDEHTSIVDYRRNR